MINRPFSILTAPPWSQDDIEAMLLVIEAQKIIITQLDSKVSNLTHILDKSRTEYAKLKVTMEWKVSSLEQKLKEQSKNQRENNAPISVRSLADINTSIFSKPAHYQLANDETLMHVRITSVWVSDDSSRATDVMLSAELIDCEGPVENTVPGIAIGIRAHSTDYPERALPRLLPGDEVTMVVRIKGTQITKRQNIGLSGKGYGIYYILRPAVTSMANRPAPAVIIDVINKEGI